MIFEHVLIVVLGLCLMFASVFWWSARTRCEELAEELVRRRGEALELERALEDQAGRTATVRRERDDALRSCDELFDRVIAADLETERLAHQVSLIRVQARLGLSPLGGRPVRMRPVQPSDGVLLEKTPEVDDEALREIGFGSALPKAEAV